ncbi:acyl-CoA N-acyltransferase [Myriangium duriaei CBS 260.36]|uniref:Acyl-CoA N-acyltransferase n=1 Tax=Myriangium duriaei CBS 260.36 TaxID=1168546 RepID=A0A9P4MGY0_9PEZI|nr:acyl-CoA N-acyltransferase [Myriangium duriaei CBS 260.36]
MASADVVIFHPDQHQHLLAEIARIHVHSIEEDGVCLVFLPPFHKDSDGTDPVVLKFWQEHIVEVRQDRAVIIMQLAGSRVAGVVVLRMPVTQTGSFRGEVEKLIVSPDFRRQGIATRLMEALENEAKSRGRTLLQLGTTEGYPAQQMYPKLGYIEYGRIPEHAISPTTGKRLSNIFFYKNLA